MHVTILYTDKQIYVNGEAIKIDNWGSLNLPNGVLAVQYNTDAKSGHIEFEGDLVANMPIGEAQFNVFSHCIGIWETQKTNEEIIRLEAVRVQSEERAKARTEAIVKATEDRIRLEALENKIVVLESIAKEKRESLE